jgi:putative NADH-flavin reductase
MRVVVIGASGKVGRQVVELALERGYSVVATVHSHNPFEERSNLTVIKLDIKAPSSLAEALAGSQAVVVTLGSWHTKTKDIVSSGIKAIIPAMEKAGISRIITVTGAGALFAQDTPTVFDRGIHRLLGFAAGKILRDAEEHLRLLEASNLNWTAVRAPVMTRSRSTSYHLDSKKLAAPWATIPRAAVVACIVDQITDTHYLKQAPVIKAH